MATTIREKYREIRGLFQSIALGFAVLLFWVSTAHCANTGKSNKKYSPGDIVVNTTSADGAAIKGARVRVVLPGPDGSLEKAPNILFEASDGDKYDADGAKNGTVVFSIRDTGDYMDSETEILLDITLKGYVPLSDIERTCKKDIVNSFDIEMQKQKTGKK